MWQLLRYYDHDHVTLLSVTTTNNNVASSNPTKDVKSTKNFTDFTPLSGELSVSLCSYANWDKMSTCQGERSRDMRLSD